MRASIAVAMRHCLAEVSWEAGELMGGGRQGRAERRERAAVASQEWTDLQARCLWPEQELYELVRPVVLFNQPRARRARETGVSAKTISRAVARFVQQGLPGLSASAPPRKDDGRRLPSAIRERILRLKAEHPPLTAHELATICAVAFDRGLDYRTVTRVLACQPLPGGVPRRYPHYVEIADPEERRLAVIRLHAEGWTPSRIAEYLDTSRQTVHATLRRWVEEGVHGLADKSHARKPSARKATLPAIAAIRTLQENLALGRQRVHAALKRLGIDLSPRTCGRIMAKNRALYGLAPARPVAKPRKPMPFAASRPHQYWSVDIRYIEHHRVPEYADQPIYIITILDNYSRAIVASAPSPSQDLTAFLLVLFTAIHVHGAPEALVSDGGSVFRANDAMEIYERLGIHKEQIERRRPYQNYVESHFNIMRRMADYYFEQATSWDEFCAIHARFVTEYNWQEHLAHRERGDGRHAPHEVLGWFKGRQIELPTLDTIFHAAHDRRHVDRYGYIRYRYWRLYGEEGLVGERVSVWLVADTLTIARTPTGGTGWGGLVEDEPVAQYTVLYGQDAPSAERYRRPRPYQTFVDVVEARPVSAGAPLSSQALQQRAPALQAPLWDLSRIEWRRVVRLEPRVRQRVQQVRLGRSPGTSGTVRTTMEQQWLFA